MQFLKQLFMKAALESYEDFEGILVEKKPIRGKAGIIEWTLKNEERKVKVEFGAAASERYQIGDTVLVGHIGRKVINIRPIKSDSTLRR